MAADNRGAVRCRAAAGAALLLVVATPGMLWLLLATTALYPDAPVSDAGGLAGGLGPAPVAAVRLLLLCAWAFLVAMDERALGPLVLHEPLVAAPVGGALLGFFPQGLVIGLLLQAIWPGLLPLGGSRQPSTGLAAVIGVSWLVLLPGAVGPVRLALSLAAALAAAGWGERCERIWRRRNGAREPGVYAAPLPGRRARLRKLIQAGLLESGLTGPLGLALFVGLPLLILLLADLATGGRSAATLSPRGHLSEQMAAGSVSWGSHAALVAPCVFFALGGFIGNRGRRWLRRIRWRHGASTGVGGHGADRRAEPAGGPRGEEPGRMAHVPVPRLGPRRLWAILTLQACFSDQHLQRSGFLHALEGSPCADAAGAECGQAAGLEERMAAQGILNTQPAMAAALVGALDRVLCDAQKEPLPRCPLKLLEVGGPVLAQWGDRALWGGLCPATALLALALLPVWPAGVVAAYMSGGLILNLAMRLQLYRWGWRAGWGIVRGGRGRIWREGPSWVHAALLPLGLVAALSLGAAWIGAAPAAGGGLLSASGLGLVWFIIGVPFGMSMGSRPLLWGWVCWAAGLLGALLAATANWF